MQVKAVNRRRPKVLHRVRALGLSLLIDAPHEPYNVPQLQSLDLDGMFREGLHEFKGRRRGNRYIVFCFG